ncbi:hypothetical protein [Streptomyces sp. NPDC047028]|uniref:hypothetical protein n=1 Tax=Streptomyces sp. NPDC047028 TaxID=3155793 RepID=UPI0033C56E37
MRAFLRARTPSKEALELITQIAATSPAPPGRQDPDAVLKEIFRAYPEAARLPAEELYGILAAARGD